MDARQIYSELNKMYSSEHNDNAGEMGNALFELEQVIAQGTKPETLFTKMKQMVNKLRVDSLYKTKLSTVIMNRFWEKEYVEMIPLRQFKIEQ